LPCADLFSPLDNVPTRPLLAIVAVTFSPPFPEQVVPLVSCDRTPLSWPLFFYFMMLFLCRRASLSSLCFFNALKSRMRCSFSFPSRCVVSLFFHLGFFPLRGLSSGSPHSLNKGPGGMWALESPLVLPLSVGDVLFAMPGPGCRPPTAGLRLPSVNSSPPNFTGDLDYTLTWRTLE